jgi:RNA polymerase sigma factor (sigma-70 family)
VTEPHAPGPDSPDTPDRADAPPSPEGPEERSDRELIDAVRAGDESAYAELWHRHRRAAVRLARQVAPPSDVDDVVSESFLRVHRAIAHGGGPEAAFRPYLLSTLRRVGIDTGRSYYTRVELTREDRDLEREHAPAADDAVLDNAENSAAWRAWASLPEETRSLLWHLVIEEETPAALAPVLGTSANGVASRAKRAREKLRQAFLEQHVLAADNEICAEVRRKLPRYVREALTERDRRCVDDHLAGCAACSQALREMADVNFALRSAVAPVVLGGPDLARQYWRMARAARWASRPRLALVGTLAAASVTAAVVLATAAPSPHRVDRGASASPTSSALVRPASPTSRAATPTRRHAVTPGPAPRPTVRSSSTTTVTPPRVVTGSTASAVRTVVPPAPQPRAASGSTGSTQVRQVAVGLPGMSTQDRSVTVIASSGWVIVSIAGPAGTTCSVAPDGSGHCTLSATGSPALTVRVSGPAGASGSLRASYQDQSGATVATTATF